MKKYIIETRNKGWAQMHYIYEVDANSEEEARELIMNNSYNDNVRILDDWFEDYENGDVEILEVDEIIMEKD